MGASESERGSRWVGGAERVEGEGWTRDGKRGENGRDDRKRDEDEGSREAERGGSSTMLERNKWRKSGKMGMR